jgi:hypothetical protein
MVASGASSIRGRQGAPILRNQTPIQDPRHLTDLFTDEAIGFIEAQFELYHLSNDLGEQRELAAAQPMIYNSNCKS